MLPIKDDYPLHRFPLITVVLIGLNVFIFLRQSDLVGEQKDEFWYKYGSIPWEIVHNTGTFDRFFSAVDAHYVDIFTC